MKLKRYLRILWLAVFLMLTGCGEPRSETQGVPAPPPPQPPPTEDIGDTSTESDSRLPQEYLDRSVPLNPATDAADAFRIIFADYFIGPVIGNIPLTLRVSLPKQFEGSEFFLGVEDPLGFSWAILPYFLKTGVLNTSSIDMVFADESVAVRVIGLRSGDNVSGNVYYRTDHSCQYDLILCDYPPGYPYPLPPECDVDAELIRSAGECKASLDVTDTGHVKRVGAFSNARLSRWVW